MEEGEKWQYVDVKRSMGGFEALAVATLVWIWRLESIGYIFFRERLGFGEHVWGRSSVWRLGGLQPHFGVFREFGFDASDDEICRILSL